MNENNSNLPVVQKNGLLTKSKRAIPQISDGMKRIGKVIGAGTVAMTRTDLQQF